MRVVLNLHIDNHWWTSNDFDWFYDIFPHNETFSIRAFNFTKCGVTFTNLENKVLNENDDEILSNVCTFRYSVFELNDKNEPIINLYFE